MARAPLADFAVVPFPRNTTIGASMNDGEVAGFAKHLRQESDNHAAKHSLSDGVCDRRPMADTPTTGGCLIGCPAVDREHRALFRAILDSAIRISSRIGAITAATMQRPTSKIVSLTRAAARSFAAAEGVNGLTAADGCVMDTDPRLLAHQKAPPLGVFSGHAGKQLAAMHAAQGQR